MSANTMPMYELQRPTHSVALESLSRYLGDDEAIEVWSVACEQLKVDPHNENTAASELLSIVDALDTSDRLVATCAASLRIRIMSYLILVDRPPAPLPPMGA